MWTGASCPQRELGEVGSQISVSSPWAMRIAVLRTSIIMVLLELILDSTSLYVLQYNAYEDP